MNTLELIELVKTLYDRALKGERLLLTGDSFFIGVVEKQLVAKLASSRTIDISLATYKPSLNAHFFSGGQIVVIDFFSHDRGLHQLQFLDNLDEVIILEAKPGSSQVKINDHILPVSRQYDRVTFITKEC